jgi:hypothetical protein
MIDEVRAFLAGRVDGWNEATILRLSVGCVVRAQAPRIVETGVVQAGSWYVGVAVGKSTGLPHTHVVASSEKAARTQIDLAAEALGALEVRPVAPNAIRWLFASATWRGGTPVELVEAELRIRCYVRTFCEVTTRSGKTPAMLAGMADAPLSIEAAIARALPEEPAAIPPIPALQPARPDAPAGSVAMTLVVPENVASLLERLLAGEVPPAHARALGAASRWKRLARALRGRVRQDKEALDKAAEYVADIEDSIANMERDLGAAQAATTAAEQQRDEARRVALAAATEAIAEAEQRGAAWRERALRWKRLARRLRAGRAQSVPPTPSPPEPTAPPIPAPAPQAAEPAPFGLFRPERAFPFEPTKPAQPIEHAPEKKRRRPRVRRNIPENIPAPDATASPAGRTATPRQPPPPRGPSGADLRAAERDLVVDDQGALDLDLEEELAPPSSGTPDVEDAAPDSNAAPPSEPPAPLPPPIVRRKIEDLLAERREKQRLASGYYVAAAEKPDPPEKPTLADGQREAPEDEESDEEDDA